MPETTSPSTMPTQLLCDALRGHYIKPGELRPGAVFLTEVTAPDRVHRADAVHIGLWASRGYTVDVHELKTSHADFRRELDKPDKAEAWWEHCNTFWIVAPNTSVAPPEMLPAGWGLLTPGGRGRRFKTVVPAVHRDLRPSTALLAALLVSMETDRDNALRSQRQRLETQRFQDVQEARRAGVLAGAPSDLREQVKHLEQLERVIGFKLGGYDDPDTVSVTTLAASIREVVGERMAVGGLDYVLRALVGDAGALAVSAERARKHLAERTGDARLLPAAPGSAPDAGGALGGAL